MTDEDKFQAALDADPDDHFTRGVLADYLDSISDPRADGYAKLAELRKAPSIGIKTTHEWWSVPDTLPDLNMELPRDWFDEIHDADRDYVGSDGKNVVSKDYISRRKAEDSAALAYASLLAKSYCPVKEAV